MLFQVRGNAEVLDSIATALPEIWKNSPLSLIHTPIQQHLIYATQEDFKMSDNLFRRQIIKAAGIFFTRAASAGTISLISNLIARSPIVSAAKAQAIPGDYLKNEAVYTLEWRDHKKDPRLLDGRTEGKVGLASKTTSSSGTKWQVFRSGPPGKGIYSFKCQSIKKGPRWLDGRTAEGKVGLALTVAGFSGTRWRVSKVPELGVYNVYKLECLGYIGGTTWLEGRTGKYETVGLANEEQDSRTSWRISQVG